MTDILFHVTLPPPSVNRAHVMRRSHTGASWIGKSKDYTGWIKSAALEIRSQNPGVRIEGDITLHLNIRRDDPRSDLDNREKALIDAIQSSGVIVNDRQIVEKHTRWLATAGCAVTGAIVPKVSA